MIKHPTPPTEDNPRGKMGWRGTIRYSVTVMRISTVLNKDNLLLYWLLYHNLRFLIYAYTTIIFIYIII